MSDTLFESWESFNEYCYDRVTLDRWEWQVFYPQISHTITSVLVLLCAQYWDTADLGNITAEIQSTVWDDGVESGDPPCWKPSGIALCSGTIDTSLITTEDQFGDWYEITLGAGAFLVAGSKYAIVLKGEVLGDNGEIGWFYDYETDPLYHGGKDCGYKNVDEEQWWSWWGQTYAFREYGILGEFSGLWDANLSDLIITLDDTEIRNDLRVMIPHYSYDLSYVGEAVTVNYRDLVYTSLDGDSINKYGRRSKVNKYQVMDETFQEAWCENQKQKYAEPYYWAEATIPGSDANMLKCLATKVSSVVSLLNMVSGINNEYMVDSYMLEARQGYLAVKLGLREMDTEQQLTLFVIDADLIDGDHVIG